jgi:XTP/dITP diphosphohydrolase
MTELLFVTNNQNKLGEISALMPDNLKILKLSDINFHQDIPETENTIEGNSLLKAIAVNELYKGMCFAEDTGLEIKALNGEPGVRSARYAGEGKCNQDNINLVLNKMKGAKDNTARFKTVLTFFDGRYLRRSNNR